MRVCACLCVCERERVDGRQCVVGGACWAGGHSGDEHGESDDRASWRTTGLHALGHVLPARRSQPEPGLASAQPGRRLPTNEPGTFSCSTLVSSS